MTRAARAPAGPRESPRDARVRRLLDLAPGLLAVVLFVVVGAWNAARGLDLWMWYAFVGAGLGSVVLALLYAADARVPHYLFATVSIGLMLHYAGGSLGTPDPEARGFLGISGINGAYHSFGWWDHLTHFVGIAAAAMGYVHLADVAALRRGARLPAWFLGAFAFLAGLATGVAVELYEFAGKTWFQTIDQGGYANTLQDLGWNTLGSAAGAAGALLMNRVVLRRDIEARWLGRGKAGGLVVLGLRLPPGLLVALVLCAGMAAGHVADMVQWAAQGTPRPDTAEDVARYDEALGRLARFTFVALGLAAATFAALLVRPRRGAGRPAADPEGK